MVMLKIFQEDIESIQEEWGRRREFKENLSAFLKHLIPEDVKHDPLPKSFAQSMVALPKAGISDYDPDAPPDVSFSSILKVRIGGQERGQIKWVELLGLAIEIGCAAGLKTEDLSNVMRIPMGYGRKVEDGYYYVSRYNISYQTRKSQVAYWGALNLAKFLGVEFEIIISPKESNGSVRSRMHLASRN